MKIRKYKISDADEVSKMVRKSLEKFVAPGYSKKGIGILLDEQSPKKQAERAKIREVYVLEDSGKIIGMVEGRIIKNYGKISRLFVDEKYHKRGVGKKLITKMEAILKKKGVRQIRLWASLYALPFYQRQGYKKTTRLIKRGGMIYQPVKKVL